MASQEISKLKKEKTAAASDCAASAKASKGLDSKIQTLSSELKLAKEAKTVMKTKLEQAENKSNKLSAQLQEASKQVEASEKQLKTQQMSAAAAEKKLKDMEALLSATDVQYFLSLRDASAGGLAKLQEHSSTAYAKGLEGLEIATTQSGELYEQATKEATRLYAKGAPVILEQHKQIMDTAAPHVTAATEHVQFGIASLTKQLEAVLAAIEPSVPAIKPHSAQIAKIMAHVIIFLPLVFLFLFVHLKVVSTMSKLLLKIEYAVLFFLLGVVLTVCGLSFALQKDPIKELRLKNVETHDKVHFFLGYLGMGLGVIQFSIFLAKAETGKGRFALAASLAAAVANLSFLVHYYNLAFKKAQANTNFEMAFQLNGDGMASFAEYAIFATIVVLVAAVGTPSQWRLSIRAFLVAVQASFAGFFLTLKMLDPVLPKGLESMLKVPYFLEGIAVFAGLLVLVTVYKALMSLVEFLCFRRAGSFIPAIRYGAQLAYVVEALNRVGQVLYANRKNGTADTVQIQHITHCFNVFLGVAVVHILIDEYASSSQKAQAASAKPNKATPAKGKGKGKGK